MVAFSVSMMKQSIPLSNAEYPSSVCKNCGKKFPNYISINGKRHNLHNRKYCLECSPFNQHNTKKIGKFRAYVIDVYGNYCLIKAKDVKKFIELYFKHVEYIEKVKAMPAEKQAKKLAKEKAFEESSMIFTKNY